MEEQKRDFIRRYRAVVVKQEEWKKEFVAELTRKQQKLQTVLVPYCTALKTLEGKTALVKERWQAVVQRIYQKNVFFIADLDHLLRRVLVDIR